MIKTAEKPSGFFESVSSARNPKSNEKVERFGEHENERFERTLNSVKNENHETKKAIAPKNPQNPRETRSEKISASEKKETPKQNAKSESAKASVEVEIEIGEKEIFDFEIENVNSSFAEITLENAKELSIIDIDAKLEAIEDIFAALRNIIDILKLRTVEIKFGLDSTITDEDISQLAQIVSLLKEIGNMLLELGLNDKEIEIADGETISANEAIAIGQYLLQEAVKLELNFAKLGITEEVAQAVAKINPEIQTNTGINIAADLSEKTPAQQILPKTIETILSKEEVSETNIDKGEIKEIIEKLKNVLKGGENKTEPAQTAQKTAQTVKISENAEVSEIKEKPITKDIKTSEIMMKFETPKNTSSIKALAGLKKEIVNEAPKTETKIAVKEAVISATETKLTTEKVKISTAEGKNAEVVKTEITKVVASEIKTSEKPSNESKINETALIKEINEVKESKLAEVFTGKDQNKKENGQNNKNENFVPNNESVAPIRDAHLRANEGNIASPIALDGVAIEANKFSDSSEITSVSPRFVKIFEKEIVEQVQRTILNSTNKNGIQQMTLMLNPEKLGEIKLTIQVENGVVSARLNVENSHIKSIIEQNLQSLRDALAQQNLSAGNLDVNVGSENPRELMERMRNARNQKSNGHFGKEEGVIADETLDLGVDTGRRYGTNSFEFFA